MVRLQDPLQSHNDCSPLLFGNAGLNDTRCFSGRKGSPTRSNEKHLLQIPQNQWAEGWFIQKVAESSPVRSLPLPTVYKGSLKWDGVSTPLSTREAELPPGLGRPERTWRAGTCHSGQHTIHKGSCWWITMPNVLTLCWTQPCLLSSPEVKSGKWKTYFEPVFRGNKSPTCCRVTAHEHFLNFLHQVG